MVVVVGMARSGLAVARLLRNRGFDVFATDSNPDPRLRPEFDRIGVPSETGGHSSERLAAAEEIVISPGVPLEIAPLTEARRRGVSIVSELEVASRYLRGDIVAITGSNGKTTTASLTAHMLRAGSRPVQLGGNIGIAASDLVDPSTDETINVVEVSSFQLDGIHRFRPRLGALLNITPDHLDRYGDLEAYRMSKFRLFRNQTAGEFAVLNADDPNTYPPPVPIRSRQLLFSRRRRVDDGACLTGGVLEVRGRGVLPAREVPLRGGHNLENALAAMLAADVYGVAPDEVRGAIKSFRGVEHRLETVATIEAVEFVNDSKATNVDSAVKAVEAFMGNLIVILGGKDKGASYDPLIQTMMGRVRHVVTLGAAADRIEQAIGGALPTRRVGSMAEAVEVAADLARPGDTVLLAPACASFDMYENYEERGKDFKRAILSLMKATSEE